MSILNSKFTLIVVSKVTGGSWLTSAVNGIKIKHNPANVCINDKNAAIAAIRKDGPIAYKERVCDGLKKSDSEEIVRQTGPEVLYDNLISNGSQVDPDLQPFTIMEAFRKELVPWVAPDTVDEHPNEQQEIRHLLDELNNDIAEHLNDKEKIEDNHSDNNNKNNIFYFTLQYLDKIRKIATNFCDKLHIMIGMVKDVTRKNFKGSSKIEDPYKYFQNQLYNMFNHRKHPFYVDIRYYRKIFLRHITDTKRVEQVIGEYEEFVEKNQKIEYYKCRDMSRNRTMNYIGDNTIKIITRPMMYSSFSAQTIEQLDLVHNFVKLLISEDEGELTKDQLIMKFNESEKVRNSFKEIYPLLNKRNTNDGTSLSLSNNMNTIIIEINDDIIINPNEAWKMLVESSECYRMIELHQEAEHRMLSNVQDEIADLKSKVLSLIRKKSMQMITLSVHSNMWEITNTNMIPKIKDTRADTDNRVLLQKLVMDRFGIHDNRYNQSKEFWIYFGDYATDYTTDAEEKIVEIQIGNPMNIVLYSQKDCYQKLVEVTQESCPDSWNKLASVGGGVVNKITYSANDCFVRLLRIDSAKHRPYSSETMWQISKSLRPPRRESNARREIRFNDDNGTLSLRLCYKEIVNQILVILLLLLKNMR